MTLTIKNHRLDGVDFVASPNVGAIINGGGPVGIVNHYTAGYNGVGAINTFLNKASKVSAHIVIDRSGKITQMVPFNKVAWHAGPSRYQAWNGLNQFFVGIEYDNIGYVKKTADGGYVDPYGKKFTPDPGQTLVAEKEPRIGADVYYWPSYTDAQIAAGMEVEKALIAKYDIQAIVTHEEIDTRGWKTDPGPAFPQQAFKDLLKTNHQDSAIPVASAAIKAEVTASTLNVRSGAGPQWDKFAQLAKGNIVTIKDTLNDWSYIEFGVARNGWVSSQYLQRV